jgi:hypothetical protein
MPLRSAHTWSRSWCPRFDQAMLSCSITSPLTNSLRFGQRLNKRVQNCAFCRPTVGPQSDRTRIRETESVLPCRASTLLQRRLRFNEDRPRTLHARRVHTLCPPLRLPIYYIEAEIALTTTFGAFSSHPRVVERGIPSRWRSSRSPCVGRDRGVGDRSAAVVGPESSSGVIICRSLTPFNSPNRADVLRCEIVAAVTTTRAGKCRMSMETAGRSTPP